jgi:hypothetical protein
MKKVEAIIMPFTLGEFKEEPAGLTAEGLTSNQVETLSTRWPSRITSTFERAV